MRYKLVHDPASWVAVDERSGAVVTRQHIDRESPYVHNSFYVIIAHAVDDGKCLPQIGGKLSLLVRANHTHESFSINGENANLFMTVMSTGDGF